MSCERSITFTIPGASGSPGLKVTVVEDNGSLVFDLEVLDSSTSTADLRGLFFNLNDDSKLAGLTISANDGTVTELAANAGKVLDLGNGANMNGALKKGQGFDVGLEFGTQGIGKGDDIQDAGFTLTNAAGNLTLDDIANTLFGARLTSVGAPDGGRDGSVKLTYTAPAAPDARDDSYSIFEDGQAGLDSPASVPTGVVFQVLANDTDADGDTLTITEVFGALHGTVTIIDGDDADLLPGDAVLYTPTADYAGTDSFTYCISDNNGGTDFAEVAVAIAAVADVPDLTYEVFAGNAVNQIRLVVSATQTDDDGSEYIDRLLWSVDGGLPPGVSIVPDGPLDPAGTPGQLVREFLITLPLDTDTSFTLNLEAISKETSNGDTESATTSLDVVYEYNLNQYQRTFLATDQSIWDSGDQFTFDDDRFIGIDRNWSDSSDGLITYDFAASLKAGFQSDLHFEGGEIDANLPFDISIDTNYNKTTDTLLIGSSALLTGGDFQTEGPQGQYTLDFLFEYALYLAAKIDLPGIVNDLGVGDPSIPTIDIGDDYSFNILDLNSDNLGFELPLPLGFSVGFAWPNLTTDASQSGNTFESDGASNNFLQLNLDLDDFVFALLGLPNPLSLDFDFGPVFLNLDLIDLDLFVGTNFLQDFTMQVLGLPGILTFEDGTQQAFTFGTDILLQNASAIDQGGDGDGQVEFNLSLDPNVDLSNLTRVGFNAGYEFAIGRFEAGYDIEIYSDSVEFTLFETGGSTALPIPPITVYNDTFALDFQAQDLVFAA